MRRTIALRVAAASATAVALLAAMAPSAVAKTKSPWDRADADTWYVGAGADNYRTGFNPTEKRPAFFAGGHLGTGDSDGPWLQWKTKISDLPSGIFPGAGIIVEDGIVYVSGGATNSFLALNAETGLPVWRFAPDQRADGYASQYPSSNAPVVRNGIVYATFSNGFLYALDAKTGRKIWSYRAKDKWQGGPPPPGVSGDPTRERGSGPFDPVHPPIDYPKIHGVTAYCDNKVFFMTLSGYAYGLDARTGRLLWHKYVDNPDFPGELTWWEYKRGGALKVENKSVGSSTRRFEAVPGLGCLHGEVTILASDGVIRWFDANTGAKIGEYDRIGPDGTNFCQSAAWNCDAAIGQSDPNTGDYLITTLNGRLLRITWDDHEVVWQRSVTAPLPFQVGTAMPLSLAHEEEGFVMESVGAGPMAEDVTRKVLYVGNQDGHIYALDISGATGGGLRPSDNGSPTLLSYTGISPNAEPRTPYTRKDTGGPWDYNQQALSSLVLGGDVLYAPTWDNKVTAFRVDNPASPQKIWQYEVTTEASFPYPPFGETFADRYYKENFGAPFADLDNKIFSGLALVDGHLFFSANDGSVYCFNLHTPVKTVKNLVLLGSGNVPFLPEWAEAVGAFDTVWTPEDWYKNQVAPPGWRFPKPAGIVSASGMAWFAAGLWWWVRRRDEEDQAT